MLPQLRQEELAACPARVWPFQERSTDRHQMIPESLMLNKSADSSHSWLSSLLALHLEISGVSTAPVLPAVLGL